MVEIKGNKSNTAIVLTFKGKVDAHQVEQACIEFQKMILKYDSGFKALTDLSLLESMQTKAYAGIEKMMHLCQQQGISKIVRVVPDANKDIGFNIMSLCNYSNDVAIVTYKTPAEALRNVFLGEAVSK